MKHLITLLAWLPLLAAAQNISVKSFRSVPEDMTARVTAPVKDQNGEKCALIKVRTTQTGFVFDGDMLGITKTVQEVGEIWVYMPNKAKKLTIKHAQLGVMDNYLYTEPIKEATVYIMELTTSKVVTSVIEEDIKTAYLIIKSDPEGADVYIDDTYLGITPFNKKMTAGSYTYRVEMNMYQASAGKIVISGDNPREELNLTLASAFGYAKITTTPEDGATVSINGESTGLKTPMTTQKLKSGTYQVTVKLPMYQPITKEFIITDGQTTDVPMTLTPSFANVTINTSPAADIYIDAEKVGNGTYTGRVMEGIHGFEARKDKHNEAKQQVELKAGIDKTINLNLQPKLGNLDITTNPMDAVIRINGEEKGKTPTTLKGLLIGEYNLTLDKKGFDIINKTITINENKTTQLNETFTIKGVIPKQETATALEKKPEETKIENKPLPNYATKATGYRKAKNTFFILSGVGAGVGGYFAFSANNKYDDYQAADNTSEATDLHQQVETQDIIWKTSFGVSAASLVTGLIFTNKEKKAKQNFKAAIAPVEGGMGLNLVYNF